MQLKHQRRSILWAWVAIQCGCFPEPPKLFDAAAGADVQKIEHRIDLSVMPTHHGPLEQCRGIINASIEGGEYSLQFGCGDSLRKVPRKLEQVGEILQMLEVQIVVFCEGCRHWSTQEPIDCDNIVQI